VHDYVVDVVVGQEEILSFEILDLKQCFNFENKFV
jgi:hypothetical protein